MSSSTNSLESRRRLLNDGPQPTSGTCVLYIMSRDQRLHDNHALLLAQQEAGLQKLPLHVLFVLRHKGGQRAREQYQFMLDGLRNLSQEALALNISFTLCAGADAIKTVEELHPAAVINDFSPLRGSRRFRALIAQKINAPCHEVDTHNCVPVWIASPKQEFAARTLRPKLHAKFADYLQAPEPLSKHPYGTAKVNLDEAAIREVHATVPSNGQKLTWKSGEAAAHEALRDFVTHRLPGYATNRNDPTIDGLSGLSPYLHFGQLSSLRVVLEALQHKTADTAADVDALIEEIIVRKELSDNFCYYSDHYRSLQGAPDWARATLEAHRTEPREFLYTKQQLEHAQTHDEAWNASQRQLTRTGKMHGYMRMYWAKKVLEWTESPEQALEILTYLNDFYSIDGGDPNGYTGILWSIAGLHDRPWFERPVFGTVRYMNAAGLKRKFKIDQYIAAYPA